MRIGILTHDLREDNSRLMPWRMLLEVAQGWERQGHSAVVLSCLPNSMSRTWRCQGCCVRAIGKLRTDASRHAFAQVLDAQAFDVLFWPVAWRSMACYRDALDRVPMPVVWYMPGAHYSLRQTLGALPAVGVRRALPYVTQSLCLKRHWVRTLRQPARRLLVTVSPFNRRHIQAAGWPARDIVAVWPGRAAHPPAQGPSPRFEQWRDRLQDAPYFLFFGPPQAIRGVGTLLRAFSRVARRHANVRLVCLFRNDTGLDATRWRHRIARLACRDRIVCLWESLQIPDVMAFVQHCHAVVKPFLLVPSEIPLAVIEAAGCAKPVVTTGPGGTAEFVSRFGLWTRPGDSRALARAMCHLLEDTDAYAEACQAAQAVYAAHPSWTEVSQSWLTMAQRAVDEAHTARAVTAIGEVRATGT